MNIIWLASYPRSGNTFTRLLLYNYLHGKVTNTADVAQRIPDIHKLEQQGMRLDLSLQGTMVMKSHYCLTVNHPYRDMTGGFIYIFRNPRDVLFSSARFLGHDGSPEALRDYARSFIQTMGAPHWKQISMGTIPMHLGSWMSAGADLPHLLVKYEDLRNNTAMALSRMLRFIGIMPEQAKVEQAVRDADISRIRNLENQERSTTGNTLFDNLPDGRPFIGQGKTNQSLASLGDDVEQLYRQRFGPLTDFLGYS